MPRTRWYKDMVFYQIWPKSFLDGNGDGIGDLYGVCEKLDYIQSLGCNGIWFSPLYPSPGADCGYDISDFMDIAPEYGGMDAFKQVLDCAHQRGMKVIMDLAMNRTSDAHPWFQLSRKRVEPYTDYYIWRPEKEKKELSNSWAGYFEDKVRELGGKIQELGDKVWESDEKIWEVEENAWKYDPLRGEYYSHLFAEKQPDLNMDNPLVREEIKKILRFWLELGVDGFRGDVITYVSGKEKLPNDYTLPGFKGMRLYHFGSSLRKYLQEFREVLDDYDCMTLAEAPLASPWRSKAYINEDNGPLDMMIPLEFQCADCFVSNFLPTRFSLRNLKRAFSRWQLPLQRNAWNMLYLETPNRPRVVSRYGSEEYREASAKMLAVSYLFQKGTPFIYQGQEIGMTNWRPAKPGMYQDAQTVWQYWNKALTKTPEERLRRLWRSSPDSARTLMQWSAGENAGFTTGKPCFYANENYKEINVEEQEQNPDSVLNFYRKAIALRKELPCIRLGDYQEHFPLSNEVYVYSRRDDHQRLLIICSFSKQEQAVPVPDSFYLPHGKLILCNYPEPVSDTLRPYEARVYLFR